MPDYIDTKPCPCCPRRSSSSSSGSESPGPGVCVTCCDGRPAPANMTATVLFEPTGGDPPVTMVVPITYSESLNQWEGFTPILAASIRLRVRVLCFEGTWSWSVQTVGTPNPSGTSDSDFTAADCDGFSLSGDLGDTVSGFKYRPEESPDFLPLFTGADEVDVSVTVSGTPPAGRCACAFGPYPDTLYAQVTFAGCDAYTGTVPITYDPDLDRWTGAGPAVGNCDTAVTLYCVDGNWQYVVEIRRVENPVDALQVSGSTPIVGGPLDITDSWPGSTAAFPVSECCPDPIDISLVISE